MKPMSKIAKAIVASILSFGSIHAAVALELGVPHSTVQTLTKDNFDAALNDPANGLWLLKFYGKIRPSPLFLNILLP